MLREGKVLFSSSSGALLYVTEGKCKGTVKKAHKIHPACMKSQNAFQKMRKKVYAGFTLSNTKISTKPDISVILCTLAGQSQCQSNTSLTASKNYINDSAPMQNDFATPL